MRSRLCLLPRVRSFSLLVLLVASATSAVAQCALQWQQGSLVGLLARAQVMSIELTPQLTGSAITTTNAIDFTVGQF